MNSEAEIFKNMGNQRFQERNYQEAYEYYTRAIQINPKVSIYFSNRGKALKMLHRFDEALADAQDAIELDEQNIKAHYLTGCFKRYDSLRNGSNSQGY